MSKAEQRKRDRTVTREIHRLFWHATIQDKPGLIICLLTRFPALVIYNMFIPLQVAYGLQAVVSDDFGAVKHHAGVIITLAAAYGLCWAIGGYSISRNGRIGSVWIQERVLANFLRKDDDFYANSFIGALGSQATRLREVYSEYCQIFLLNGPIQLSIVLSGIIIIATKSLVLALVTLLAMALVLSVTIASSRYRMRFRRRLGEANSALSGDITDALSHASTVKSFANEEYEARRLAQQLAEWGKAQYETWTSSIPVDVIRMLTLAAITGILLLMTASLYHQHSISFAIVALVQLYSIRLISTAEAIAGIVKQYETVMGTAFQPVETLQVQTTVNDVADAAYLANNAGNTISFENVSYHYPDAATHNLAIRDFTLTISSGEKIGLVGYSGSGKTTLTKLLLRNLDTTTGEIRVDGINIRNIAQSSLREHIAYVPQEPVLFHRTIAENISYAKPDASEDVIRQVSHQAYVDEFVDALPKRYKTYVGERGIKLSGGQRQRVAIARALLKDAPILVLDEATSALDSESEKYIQEALWQLMKDRTAIVIAHRLSTVQRMDRIVVMDKGKIVQQGSHAELLKDKKGIYAKLWAHQSGGYLPKNNDGK